MGLLEALCGRLLLLRGSSLRAPPLPPPVPLRARASASGCWSCGQALPPGAPLARFCPACRALQPPEPRADFFRLLGCERTFRLDAARLQQQFRALQRELHPDYFSQRPQAERDFSEQHSSLVNKAYRTLLSPLSRGLYLLELNGVELEPGTDPQADPEFLSEVMEVNEKLLEAESEAKIEDVENFIAAKQEELVQGVSRAFDEGDLQGAKTLLAKMKYFANLEEKVKRKKVPS
ncbi:iron-sulfur cluster co-chaperone protein HscB [Pogona vitticeps]